MCLLTYVPIVQVYLLHTKRRLFRKNGLILLCCISISVLLDPKIANFEVSLSKHFHQGQTLRFLGVVYQKLRQYFSNKNFFVRFLLALSVHNATTYRVQGENVGFHMKIIYTIDNLQITKEISVFAKQQFFICYYLLY